MLATQQYAADQFGLRASGRRVWGQQGRTLASAAGPPWFGVVCAEAGAEGGKLWNGRSTSRTLPTSVPRPDLFRIRDWTTDGYAYRAELYALAPDPMVSPRPVLDEDPGLPETWWKEMVAALDSLADVPPPADREAVHEEYLRRIIPAFTGHQAVATLTWSTAHGDAPLHQPQPAHPGLGGMGPRPVRIRRGHPVPVRAADPRGGRPHQDPSFPRPGPARGTHRHAHRVRPGPPGPRPRRRLRRTGRSRPRTPGRTEALPVHAYAESTLARRPPPAARRPPRSAGSSHCPLAPGSCLGSCSAAVRAAVGRAQWVRRQRWMLITYGARVRARRSIP
ncbi:conserved hypothetical protein [Streptomyces sp. Mg1]|nr:conserved hypothetical protein [Streptomyces sp. Mg1]